MEKGLRCTRSQAAPDWTVQECLILVNEINAIEGEWRHTLASFQKWQLVVENCNALDVYRSLNQCKRKWEALLTHYNQVKPYESAYWGFDVARRTQLGLPENFSAEIFQAIDKYATQRGNDEGGPASVGPLSDPDTDPEAQLRDGDRDRDGHGDGDGDAPHDVVLVHGPKRQYKRSFPQKRKVQEKLNPWRLAIGKKVKQKPYTFTQALKPPKCHTVVKATPEPSNAECNPNGGMVEPPRTWIPENLKLEPGNNVGGVEQTMAENLLDNARMINAVLEGNLGDDEDSKNHEVTQNDFTRVQGDKLIHYLGKLSDTLTQFCDHLQQCN